MNLTRSQGWVIGQFVLFALLAIAFVIFPGSGNPVLQVIGFVLAVGGLIPIMLAVLEYRSVNRSTPNISPDPDQKAALVQTGIYARIRHPIYTGVLMGATGVGLFHGHIVVIVIALVFWVFFTYKSMYEDHLLSHVYPQYSDYMERTSRFLPFL